MFCIAFESFLPFHIVGDCFHKEKDKNPQTVSLNYRRIQFQE